MPGRRWRRCLSSILALVIAGQVLTVRAASELQLDTDLDACTVRLRSATTEATVASECPGLAAALATSRWSDVISDPAELSLADLDALLRLDSYYEDPADNNAMRSRGVNIAGLADTLDEVLQHLELPVERSVWQAYRQWLNELFERWQQSLPDAPVALTDWLKSLGDGVRTAISVLGWVAMTLILALGAWGLVLLLRTAQRGAQRTFPAWGVRPARREPPADLSLAALDDDSLRLRPRHLLRIVLQSLRRTHRLGPEATLTHRELVLAANPLNDAEKAALARLAGLAERVTFSDFSPDGSEVAAAVADGRMLIGNQT